MVNTNQNTEERILEAAKTIFHRKGFEGARMQEIADEAGINKSLLHYYFRSKENLFSAVFRSAFREIFTKLFMTAGSDDPFEEKIQKLVNEYIGFLQQNSYIPGFILAELNQNPEKIAEVFKSAPFPPAMLFGRMKDSIPDRQMKDDDFREFFINLLALCIFPVAAKPLLKLMFNFGEAEYEEFLENRKEHLPEFLMNAIRKK
jgi:AcrR family transcriptional regulator